MYVIVFSSQQSKAEDFWRHCCNVFFPHVRQQLTKKMKQDHQQSIEEKKATIALLADDLQDCNNQTQAIQYENMALQAQKDVYQAESQKCQDAITHLKHAMFLMREIQTKTILSSLYTNIQHLPMISS